MVTILVIFLLLFSNSHALFLPSNSSIFPSSLNPDPAPLSNPTLKKILKAIAVKERWDPSGEVRVSELDPISVRVGRSQRYEFYVRVGRMVLTLKFSDGVVSWRKPRRDWGGFGPDFDFGRGFDEDPEPVVRGLELEGPLDLRLAGGDEEEISLHLPTLNVTNGGLRRILVGDGITIKVEGTQDVTLFHPHDIGLSFGIKANHVSYQFWPLGLPSCSPLLSVRVVGPAAVVAFRTRNSEAYIETVFQANDTVELLPEKCHSNGR